MKYERGVTLIEAVLFISIALGLIIGGLVFYQQASLAQRTQDAIRLGSALIQETRATYRDADLPAIPPDSYMPGIMVEVSEVLIAAGAVPANALGSTPDLGFNGNWTRIRSAWGQPVNVFAASRNGGPVAMVTFVDIPTAACIRLAPVDQSGSGALGSGITYVMFIDGTSSSGYALSSISAGSVTAALASERCDSDGDGRASLYIEASL